MFLVLLRITFFGPCFVSAATYSSSDQSGSRSNYKNGSFAFQELQLSPFDRVRSLIPSLQLSPMDHTHRLYFPQTELATQSARKVTRKEILSTLLNSELLRTKAQLSPQTSKNHNNNKNKKGDITKELITALLKSENKRSKATSTVSPKILLKLGSDTSKNDKKPALITALVPNRGPARISSKDYGQASYYRMKENNGSSPARNYHLNLLQKLLKPKHPRKKQHSIDKQGSYNSMSSTALSSPGWGWGKGGGGGHGYGLSGVDALLCALALLSLGGFLLNLLLNLLNLFGFGMTTSTSTYPVTVTQTNTAPAPGPTLTVPTLPLTIGSGGTGLTGFTGRTIDSMAGNVGWGRNNSGGGWGWDDSGGGWGWGWRPSEGRVKLHVQLPNKGWSSTTTTTPPPTATYPTADGLVSIISERRGRARPKREVFEPYVKPTAALDSLAKNVLNSINAATNRYECIEKVFCESNKQARIIGQWMEYFMPVFSMSVSYVGHKVGAHNSLLGHIRAIVLGAAETNCQTHFPRCGVTKKP